jgi:hypothetical protein
MHVFSGVNLVQSLRPLLCVLCYHQCLGDASHTYKTTNVYIEFIRRPIYMSEKLRNYVRKSMLESSYVVSVALLLEQKFALSSRNANMIVLTEQTPVSIQLLDTQPAS